MKNLTKVRNLRHLGTVPSTWLKRESKRQLHLEEMTRVKRSRLQLSLLSREKNLQTSTDRLQLTISQSCSRVAALIPSPSVKLLQPTLVALVQLHSKNLRMTACSTLEARLQLRNQLNLLVTTNSAQSPRLELVMNLVLVVPARWEIVIANHPATSKRSIVKMALMRNHLGTLSLM